MGVKFKREMVFPLVERRTLFTCLSLGSGGELAWLKAPGQVVVVWSAEASWDQAQYLTSICAHLGMPEPSVR